LNAIFPEMKTKVGYLSALKPGQRGRIMSFTDYELSLKLMEMGCLPGEEIEVIRIAPFGDPIAYSVSGYILSLRKSEAATVVITMSDEKA
jgi:ferrous iron transport protein A